MLDDERTDFAFRRKFLGVMAGCGAFVLLMLGSLVYVCSRPQTPELRAYEHQAIMACRAESANAARSAIYRSERETACREMEKQYVRKFHQRA